MIKYIYGKGVGTYMKTQAWENFLNRMLLQDEHDRAAGMPRGQENYCVVLCQLLGQGSVPQLEKFLRQRREAHLFISQPVAYRQGCMLVAMGHDRQVEELLREWQADFADIGGGDLAVAIGGAYSLCDIYKSLREARMAGFFQQVTGKQAFVQNFNRMGLFTSLFRQSSAELAGFCRQTIGPLMEYDKNFNTQLVDTLRALLDEDFNWTRTAARLYVHVNTLRYRYEKIRQILDMDESLAMRADLFAALRAFEVLTELKTRDNVVKMPMGKKGKVEEKYFHADKKAAVSF